MAENNQEGTRPGDWRAARLARFGVEGSEDVAAPVAQDSPAPNTDSSDTAARNDAVGVTPQEQSMVAGPSSSSAGPAMVGWGTQPPQWVGQFGAPQGPAAPPVSPATSSSVNASARSNAVGVTPQEQSMVAGPGSSSARPAMVGWSMQPPQWVGQFGAPQGPAAPPVSPATSSSVNASARSTAVGVTPQEQSMVAGPSSSSAGPAMGFWGMQPPPWVEQYGSPQGMWAPPVLPTWGIPPPGYASPMAQLTKETKKGGRPLGSKNKKEKEDDPDYVGGKYRSAPYLPETLAVDPEVPVDDNELCAACVLWRGLYVVRPCGHYAFCLSCLADEKYSAASSNRSEVCLACSKTAEEYIRGFRSGHAADPLEDD